jgi:hypothetical protein
MIPGLEGLGETGIGIGAERSAEELVELGISSAVDSILDGSSDDAVVS